MAAIRCVSVRGDILLVCIGTSVGLHEKKPRPETQEMWTIAKTGWAPDAEGRKGPHKAFGHCEHCTLYA